MDTNRKSHMANKTSAARYRIDNMDCPTEEGLIRGKLGTMPGIVGLEFDLMNRKLVVNHTLASTQPLEAALTSIGMRAIRDELPEQGGASESRDEAISDAEDVGHATRWGWLLFAGACAVASEIVQWLNGPQAIVIVLALAAVFSGGLTTYRKGWIALRNRNLNINALMAIAVTGAMIIGQWPEAAMVMFLFTVAEMIEAKSLDRARNAIRGLMALTPEEATIRQRDGTWTLTPAKAVIAGAIARVRPGERIALDGQVVSGRSTVNQAPITGESIPVEKAVGDAVFAGTINEAGSFEYRVTAVAADSTLGRIIHAIEAAQAARAPTQRFVDRFARVYTPAIFLLAIGAAIVPPLVWGMPWFDAVYRALVLLVVACPCALVISTPVTIVSGLASAARRGVLVKGGVYLEEGRKLRVLALDKTGTLTHGKPEQTDFEPLSAEDQDAVRSIAASVASRSDHPVSRAVARAAAGVRIQEVDQFAALPGRGVEGIVAGRKYFLGNHRLVQELGLSSAELEARLAAREREGKTVVLLAGETAVLAAFAVADTVREASRTAIADLHALGVKTIMLTGDNPHTAEAIAREVGIDEARGSLLPDDKLKAIEAMVGGDGGVGMVGDGINDAPALARADIGFAMGAAGTDTAIETADVALMDDDLRKIPYFIRLSRTTAAVLKQNITIALGIKAVFIVLTFTGQATMWMAVFADMGASLIVVFNGLRLLRR